ncbi:hypothetical protein UFOVP163_5 [uncultured Caudovirales phage]|uniref:Uncharacterized protein n=1 Tax=uncultured Caudovirales phage TaxID=2100421 RepID=A0A6J7WD11_9CAUD|nr:hypothetical protein UFOVP163_5 [uncultured Caudovirales phage]
MKLKPQFEKGSIYVKALNRSVNLGVATQAELLALKNAGITYLFEEENEIVLENKIEPMKEDLEYLKNKKNKK